VKAIRENICEHAIACDINVAPLETAKKNIHAAGLSSRIETRLGDGLQPLSHNEADCIVIAGMGGMNIIEIISAAHEKISNAKLILSPQHDLENLRRFLHENLYNILEEKLVCEKTKKHSRFYVIVVARRVACAEEISPYTNAEYFTGKIFSPDFAAYLREKHEKISGYISSVSGDAHELAQKQLTWLEEANAHSTMGHRAI
jgi:tRNA (adenine22-N1)-methyltransferase